MSQSLAQDLARGLSQLGVDRIFGVPGGGPNLDMIAAARDLDIEFVLTHHETAACIMAATYGKLTGRVGVAIVTRGPGLTNALNGVAQAQLDRFPLLLISDTVSRESARRIAHQRLDQVATTVPITKWSGVLGSSNSVHTVIAAGELAMQAPQGAVHLAFDSTQTGDSPPTAGAAVQSSPNDMDDIARIIGAARRPLIILGLDAINATTTVRSLLAENSTPIMVTYQAKGIVPEEWDSYCGFFTGVPAERGLLRQADLIIGVGLDSVEPMPGPWPYEATTILVHSHEVETEYFGNPRLLVVDYATALPRLFDHIVTKWDQPFTRPCLKDALLELPTQSALSPQNVVSMTNSEFPDAIATVDAGAHMLVTMPVWSAKRPNEVLISNGLATMGFSLPAAIGAAFANPDRKVMCFVGDGGLGMSLAELEVISRHSLNVTVVVFNDATLTLIQLKQTEAQRDTRSVGYALSDFAAIGAAMGLKTFTASSVDELQAAISAVAGAPSLIDARVDAADFRDIIAIARDTDA
ncbi:MAG: thiamine pyrophosphate-binding protein [Actinobacteria bacterium]|nr:thiamine pyrophosphate-binding protein [Actinomycetota bacterium]